MNKNQKNPWITVAVLVFSAFIATFNETILNVALIAISQELQVTTGTVQWLITGYMLVTSIMVPVTAFLYQTIQTRKLFLGAMGILLLGSIICLLSPNFPVLLMGRMFQAVGTGMMIPIMMNTTLLVAPREKIGTAMALCVCGITLGPAFGPSISGVILQFWGWRVSFVVLIVVVAIAIIIGFFTLDNVAELTHPHLDILSVILSTAGLGTFLYGISSVTSTPTIGIISIVIGLVIIAAFVLRQSRLEEPLLNFKPMENKFFTMGLVMVFIAMLINFSLNVVLPSFLQGALSCASMVSALVLLPGILLNAVSTNISGKILDRHGVRVMLPVGFLVFTIFLFGLSGCNDTSSLILVVVLHILIYQGLAFSMSPAQTSALATLSPDMNAHGVAIVNTFMQIAASVGSSLFGGIQASKVAAAASQGANTAQALASGFSSAIFVAGVIGVIGLGVAICYSRSLVLHSGK